MSVTSEEPVTAPVLADLHVHTEFSWDAPRGAMVESCRRAVSLGFKAVAFTDHADYSELAGGARLDLAGYLEAVAYCRRQFPRLSVWSGVELGEPHRFPSEAAILLRQGRFDLVLGSLHSVILGKKVVELSETDQIRDVNPAALMRAYFEEQLRLLEGPVEFQVLTHFEYLKRFWLAGWPTYRSEEYQAEIRTVLEAAVRRGVVLELNTTRGGDPARALCPSPVVIGWWQEAGGRLLSLGSDAHDPSTVGAGFRLAADVATQAGFAPSTARFGMWSGCP